ncbi:MAG: hypothetical protein R3E65_08430 [Steroidobacteraceae bacterium]
MLESSLVEVRAIALREPRGLADAAAGDLQDLRQVAARELIARLVERGQATAGATERLLHQLDRNERRLRHGDRLPHHVVELVMFPGHWRWRSSTASGA